MTLRLMTNKTFRDLVETQLIELFPKRLRPIREKYVSIIASYDTQAAGGSYMQLVSLSGKQDEFSCSTNHPNGMFFYDPEADAIFGVGVWFKADTPDKPQIHIIAPRGKGWAESVEQFIEKIERKIPRATFHVKELSDESQKAAPHPNFSGVIVNHGNTQSTTSYKITSPSLGMRIIEENPWIANALPQHTLRSNMQIMLE